MRYLPGLLSLLFLFSQQIYAQEDFGDILQFEDKASSLPWTNLQFNDSEEQFQFAIVTDRTGGHRPGIFMDGVRKLNLLQPEFVMSVGDLIEGYTQDTTELNRQWTEFNGFVRQLQMPFFYVPGNHDITNEVMKDLWVKQFGTTYYHFRYRDVLFLCLNSEDNVRGAGRGTVDDRQYEYIKKVLEENPDVRWTLLFMHQPLWVQEAETLRWPDVEKLLEGRPHTVFAGHRHRYVSYRRNNANYYMLATTGGGSPLRGPEFGEFDHVVWVTMTEEGPILANLWLDGILEADLLTEEGHEFLSTINNNFPIRPSPVFQAAETEFKGGTARIKLVNDRDIPMKVKLSNPFSWDYTTDLNRDTTTVPPNSVAFATFRMNPRQEDLGTNPNARLQAAVSYEAPGMPDVMVPSEYNLGPVQAFQLEKARKVTVDGDLEEWKDLPHHIQTPNPDDCSGAFQLALGEEYLYLAARITDDQIFSDTGTVAWQQDYVAVVINGDPLEISSLRTGEGWYRNSFILNVSPAHGDMPASIFYEDRLPEGSAEWVCKETEGGYSLEAAISLSYIRERQGEAWRSIRVNVGLQDRDPDEEDRLRHFWQPDWRSDANLIGSGTFFRTPLSQVQEIRDARSSED